MYGELKSKEVIELVREKRQAFETVRAEMVEDISLNSAYYEGLQWIASTGDRGLRRLRRLYEDPSPDARKLRVTANYITRFTLRSIATTFPKAIECDVAPWDYDLDPSSMFRAGVLESMLNVCIARSGYVGERRRANAARCIMGTYVVGLCIENHMRTLDIDGQSVEMPERIVRAFSAPPTSLTLDTSNTSPNLEDHDCVIYSAAMSRSAIQKRYKVKLEDDETAELGSLTQLERGLAEITNGRLYANYLSHSKTRGARVHEVHLKGPSDRFEWMHVIIEPSGHNDEEWRHVNKDDPRTPYGGSGMPLGLMVGHERTVGPWGISDVAMQRSQQNLVNLNKSMFYRHVQRSAGFNWLVDKRAFGADLTDENAAGRIHNAPGGVIMYSGGRRDQNVTPPSPVSIPSPNNSLIEAAGVERDEMRENAFRSQANFGQTKSHVPDSSFQRAIEEADQVLGTRIQSDMEMDERLLAVLLGTEIMSAKSGSPGVIRSLMDNGFGVEELGAISSIDPGRPPVQVKVRESSIRYRAHSSRKQDLDNSLVGQAVTPIQYRLALARDLDAPLTDTDRIMYQRASQAAMRVMRGEQWQPMPLGEYGEFFISAFRSAMLDKQAMRDPQARQRLMEAAQLQQQAMMQEAMSSDPQLVLQQQQMAMQAQQAEAQAAEKAEPEQEPMTLGDALASAVG